MTASEYTLKDCRLVWTSPETEDAKEMRRGLIRAFKIYDRPLAESHFPGDDAMMDDSEYVAPHGVMLLAYTPDGKPVAMSIACMFGTDCEFGRGYVIESMRRHHLLHEMGIARMHWALERGATRTCFWTRRVATPSLGNAKKMGYVEVEPYRDLGDNAQVAEVYFARPLTRDNIPEGILPPPTYHESLQVSENAKH